MSAGSYKNYTPINITGIVKVHLKCDCINGRIVNGIRESILYLFGLSSPPGHEKYKEPGVILFKEINKSVLSHITFYLEDDDQKPVDFNKETITFTCQLMKIMKIIIRIYVHTNKWVFILDVSIQLYEYLQLYKF